MKKILVFPLLISFITGCATNSLSDEERLTIINKYLNDHKITEVKKITSYNFHGWKSIDNQQLIISISAYKQFLITLMSKCSGLNFANNILVKQSMSSTLQTRFDYILVPGMHQFKCYIKSINPLNRKQANELMELINNPVKEINNIIEEK